MSGLPLVTPRLALVAKGEGQPERDRQPKGGVKLRGHHDSPQPYRLRGAPGCVRAGTVGPLPRHLII